MLKLLVTIVLFSVSCFAAHPWEPENRDLPRHKLFLETTKKQGPEIEIVFFGDSLTEGWAGNGKDVWAEHYGHLHAVNYGIGGDKTQHLIWRIENGEFEGLKPKAIVLLVGGNNLYTTDTAEDIGKGVKMILDLLHTKSPNTKVLLLAMTPAEFPKLTVDQTRIRIEEYNAVISKLNNGNSVQFLDMAPHFTDTDKHIKPNLYASDHVHLSKEGYKVWAETIDPILKKMIGGDVHVAPMPWEPENRDGAQHQSFVNNTKAHAKEIEVVFYGDSITAGWAGNGKEVWAKHYIPLHAVNYGIGGDRTQHLIWRIQQGEVDGLHPKVVVLKIGTNNLGHPDADIAKGIKAIIDLLHSKLPQTKILLLGILPRGHPTPYSVRHINSMISAYDNNSSIRFLDMGLAFADSTGEIKANLFTDGLHLTAAGYEVWAATMDPLLKLMLAAH